MDLLHKSQGISLTLANMCLVYRNRFLGEEYFGLPTVMAFALNIQVAIRLDDFQSSFTCDLLSFEKELRFFGHHIPYMLFW